MNMNTLQCERRDPINCHQHYQLGLDLCRSDCSHLLSFDQGRVVIQIAVICCCLVKDVKVAIVRLSRHSFCNCWSLRIRWLHSHLLVHTPLVYVNLFWASWLFERSSVVVCFQLFFIVQYSHRRPILSLDLVSLLISPGFASYCLLSSCGWHLALLDHNGTTTHNIRATYSDIYQSLMSVRFTIMCIGPTLYRAYVSCAHMRTCRVWYVTSRGLSSLIIAWRFIAHDC